MFPGRCSTADPGEEALHGLPDQGSREGSEILTGINSAGNNEKLASNCRVG